MTIGTPVHAATAATTTGTSTATASFTPNANERLFAFIYCRNGSAYVDPTISDSAGLTWHQVGGDFDGAAANPFIRARLYWANVGGSPSSMTVTCTVGTSTQHGVTVIQVPMDADPDVANVSSGINAAGDPSATITGTPAAAISFAVAQNSNVYTPPTGYTEIVDVAPASAAFRIGVAHDLSSPSTTAAWTSGNLSSLSILLELKESASGGASGTLAATESGSDIAALTGDVLIDGVLASTETGSDTAAFSGAPAAAITGTMEAAESGQDAAAFTAPVTRLSGRRKAPRGRIIRFADEFDPAEVPVEVAKPSALPVLAALEAEQASNKAAAAVLAARITQARKQAENAKRAALIASLQEELALIEQAIAANYEAEAAYWARLKEEDEFFLLAA